VRGEGKEQGSKERAERTCSRGLDVPFRLNGIGVRHENKSHADQGPSKGLEPGEREKKEKETRIVTSRKSIRKQKQHEPELTLSGSRVSESK
jgi:hypothetical protein